MLDVATRSTSDLLLLLTGIGVLIGAIAAGIVTVIKAISDMREKVLAAVGHNTAQVGLVKDRVDIVEEQTNGRLSHAIKELADMRVLLQRVLQVETAEDEKRLVLEYDKAQALEAVNHIKKSKPKE